MKRIERARVERVRRAVAIVGISFALGALTDVVLSWRLTLHVSGLGQPLMAENHLRAAEPAVVATSGVRPSAVSDEAITMLRRRHLQMPIEGVAPGELHDAFAETRSGGRPHEALDIMAPHRTAVHAVDEGTIAKLFTSRAGGLTIYQFDPSGTFCYYYAHLDAYVDGLAERQPIRRGQLIGYVGSTGNASPDAPHLHFAVFRLGPERQWWKGEPINPYLVLLQ